MTEVSGCTELTKFLARVGSGPLRSTKATEMEIAEDVYNVTSSTRDPYIDGLAWKPLLEAFGIGGDCYAIDPLPDNDNTTHPGFDVGGHMTDNPSGVVREGGVTYLMPLCKWHNHSKRDGIPFKHANKWMLLLEGFMQGELAATFMARLPSQERFSIVYLAGGQWTHAAISDEQATRIDREALTRVDAAVSGEYCVLFERSREDETQYFVREAHLLQT